MRQCKVLGRRINWWIDDSLALLLVFCVCGFHPVCPLMDKDKRLKEASWWERLTVGETGSCSDGLGYAQFSSVTQSCLTLCDPMDSHKTSFPVHHQFPELAQTHVPWVSDAIQPSYPLSSPSPLAFNLSQHQGLFQWVSSSHEVAKVVEFQLQHQSFQWIFRTGFLLDWLVWSPCSTRDFQESSPTPQFKSINSSVLNFIYSPNSHIHT